MILVVLLQHLLGERGAARVTIAYRARDPHMEAVIRFAESA